MERSSVDLENVSAFVIERIIEEAERSGTPLGDDEKDFLNHLPDKPTNPTAELGFNTAYEGDSPIPVLRDIGFERLCNLAKDAHSKDLDARPHGAREWQFAGAVLQAHRHPLSWLLQWAGIRIAKRSARWDRLLLVGTATLVVAVFLLGALALSVLTDGMGDFRKWTLLIVGGCVYGGLLTLLYFGVRRVESRQQEQTIEQYRCDLPVRSSASMHR
jgi:hypothetical protein